MRCSRCVSRRNRKWKSSICRSSACTLIRKMRYSPRRNGRRQRNACRLPERMRKNRLAGDSACPTKRGTDAFVCQPPIFNHDAQRTARLFDALLREERVHAERGQRNRRLPVFQGSDAERHYHETGKFDYVNTGGYYHSLPGDPRAGIRSIELPGELADLLLALRIP